VGAEVVVVQVCVCVLREKREREEERKRKRETLGVYVLRSSRAQTEQYLLPAIKGFFRSISLSPDTTLQDTLRLLTLWFEYDLKWRVRSPRDSTVSLSIRGCR